MGLCSGGALGLGLGPGPGPGPAQHRRLSHHHHPVPNRVPQNKPYLVHSPAVKAAAMARGIDNFNFNVSHHGAVVVIVCDPLCVVSQTRRMLRRCHLPCLSLVFITSILSFFHVSIPTFSLCRWASMSCVRPSAPRTVLSLIFSRHSTPTTRRMSGPPSRYVGGGWWVAGW